MYSSCFICITKNPFGCWDTSLFPCSHFRLCRKPLLSHKCAGVLTNQWAQCVITAVQNNTVALLSKDSPKSPSSVFTFYLPSCLISPRLVVSNCPFGGSCISSTPSLYSSSQESLSCPRYAPHLPIFRNGSKHVVNHVCATAVILPTYLTLPGPVFQIEMLQH